TLRTEANKVRMENDGLSQKIRYFDSPDFQEREAKEKLGFRRQEEEVVLLPESLPVSPDEKTENASAEKPRFEANRPNYEKWWKLFFPVN
ncbi:MAG: hypothetical protein ABI747_02905, partial [Candidatus Moraniibacteriota bacterium]